MKFQETANGVARAYRGTTILFPFGGKPRLVWPGGQLIDFAEPERFGRWETPEEQRKFVYQFVAGVEGQQNNGLLTVAESIRALELLRKVLTVLWEAPLIATEIQEFLDNHA